MLTSFLGNIRKEFSGYNTARLLKDMMAGLTVCAVALPLALAFGVSSGATAAAGLVTAIIAGIVIGLLGGASYQISGPTGAMSAVLIGIVAQYGLQGVFFACFAAGVLMLAAGLLKLGRLISFIPMPVIMGFTSGIAIIIAMGQIDNFFGTASQGSSNLEKLLSYGRLGFHPNWQAVGIGLLVVFIMLVWPKKWGTKIPGSLVGIIAAAVAAALLGLDHLAVVGDIPRTLLLADRLSLSNLLMCMAMGASYVNLSNDAERVLGCIDDWTYPLFMLFFVLSGASLNVTIITKVGLIGVTYILTRFGGKFLGSWLGGTITHQPAVVKDNIGWALMPQAGVAIGMATMALQQLPLQYGQQIQTVVLAATLVYEIIGPLATKSALKRAGEIHAE